MIPITADDVFLKNLSLQKLIDYLESIGWKKADHPNTRILLFHGPLDDEGMPLELVLPRSMAYVDALLRLSEVINTLAVLQGKPPRSIINEITFSRVNQIYAIS